MMNAAYVYYLKNSTSLKSQRFLQPHFAQGSRTLKGLDGKSRNPERSRSARSNRDFRIDRRFKQDEERQKQR